MLLTVWVIAVCLRAPACQDTRCPAEITAAYIQHAEATDTRVKLKLIKLVWRDLQAAQHPRLQAHLHTLLVDLITTVDPSCPCLAEGQMTDACLQTWHHEHRKRLWEQGQ